MRILEQLKLEWTGADLQAFRSMWMSRMPIPDIAERLGCSAAEVAFESPLQEQELIVNGYRYLRSEKVERYPWEE